MPDPLVVVAMREFKAGLLAREDAQMREMAGQWVTVERSLTELIELTANDFEKRKANGETVSASALYKMDRYKRLRSQARDETTKYAEWADGSLTQYQDGSLDLGLDHARQAIQLSYYPGVGAFFDRLPREAVEYQVGNAGNGRPLGELLRNRMVTNDSDVWTRLVNNLVRGTALGENPRKVAQRMRDDLTGGLNKALVIARTEGLRPYREASRATYEASGVVTGQKRLCAHDHRVCGACLADEGTVYDLGDVIPDHPQGRCTSVPIVKGMPETTWTAGQEWFDAQDEETQLSILGKGRLNAYKEGFFQFGDLVKRTDNSTWGKGLTPRSLADLLSGGRDSGAAAVDLRGQDKEDGLTEKTFPGTAKFNFRQESSGRVIVGETGSTNAAGHRTNQGLVIDSPFAQAPYTVPAEIRAYIEKRIREELIPASREVLRLRAAGDKEGRRAAASRVKQIRQSIADGAAALANRKR